VPLVGLTFLAAGGLPPPPINLQLVASNVASIPAALAVDSKRKGATGSK